MILLSHIVVATSSLIWTGFVYFYPSITRLKIAYILVILMLLSGFYLVLSKPAHLTQTCVVGLLYLAAVSFGLVSARNKLARE